MLGKKIGMTQIFNDKGMTIPVTVLKVGPCTITNIKNQTFNKNINVQIGYEYINPRKLNKPQVGTFNKLQIPCFKYLKEYETCIDEISNISIGQVITIKKLKIGNHINVSGVSIGKGFSGYQKRHHFSRGPMSHGSKNHKQPGSIGAGTTPGRVFPGKKMAGRMGGKKITIQNLEILDINTDDNILIIKGSVPGKNGNILYIYRK